MTVSTSMNRVTWQGNGATTTFAYSFPITNAAEVVLTYTDAGGNQTVLNAAQYTITGINPDTTGNAPFGGTVTYPLSGSPIAAGTSLTLQRVVPYTQPTSLTNQGGLWPNVVESSEDNLEFQIQQLADDVDRAVVGNITDLPTVDMELPPVAVRANKFLGFDSQGNVIATSPSGGSVPISSAMQPVVNASSVTVGMALLAQQVSTEQFYENFGANVDRLNDRVFVGAATVNDGDFPGVVKDWLETLIPSTTSVAQNATLSTIGGLALIGGTRLSDSGSTGRFGMGIAGFLYNDSTDPAAPDGWAVYGEARRAIGATGITQATEFDAINYEQGVDAAGYMDPYDVSANVKLINLWASNGRPDVTCGDATVGLGLVNNAGDGWQSGGRYRVGICIDAHAIVGTDGVTGIGVAMALAKGHQIVWYCATNEQAGGIVSNVSNTNNAQFIAFSDNGTAITQGNSGPILFQVAPEANVVNHLEVAAGATTFGPALKAVGSDTNIDLILLPQGTGGVDIRGTTATSANAGTSTALPAQPLGYMGIKINGVAAKIPYYNP